MDLRKIKKLIDLLEESNLAEIEIKEGEESVAWRARRRAAYAVAAPMMQRADARRTAAPVDADAGPTEAPAAARQAERPAGGHVVRAPMVGTFYASPARTSRPSSASARRSRPARRSASSRR
jgi:acetyl-CoA carboxylase biotin carboxyl carrier protein